MTEKATHPSQADDLRREAEKIARENADRSPEDLQAMSHEETRYALHELRVHKIELEMQNEALRRRQDELDVARARYFDLYDLAPVGYVTVSEKGFILEANLTAATLLGMVRGELVRQRLSQFIHQEDQDIYYGFRKRLFETGKPQACELWMVKNGSPLLWMHLEATVAQDPLTDSLRLQTGQDADRGAVIRIVMSDITERKLKEAGNLLEQLVEERSKQLRQEKSDSPPAEGVDTILLVDDEPHVLSALTRVLRNTGYQVLAAGSGSQALSIMETTKIKVIVSDEKMEGMQGSELLAEARRRFPHTLRILLSGHTTPEMAMRAVNEGGIYRFLAKPCDDAMLRSTLSAAIDKYNSDSEKYRLAEELRKAEKSLQTTLDGLVSHIALLDANGAILFVNKPWREFAKQNSATSDFVYEGVNYLKVCDEATGERSEGAARFAAGIRAVLSGEMDQFVLDYPCDAPGKARWFVGRVSSFEDEKPRRNAVVSHMDITDRKRADKALQEAHDLLEQRVEERTVQLRQEIEAHKRLQVTLRENEEKFRTVADWTYEWEYWVDPQDRALLYISPSVERITGYGREAFLADFGLINRIVHPDDRPLWDRHVEENRIQTDSAELTFRIITASGEVRWIGHVCLVVIAADGRRLGTRASNRDITMQKLAEEALQESEERLQLAITAAEVGIWEFDVVSNCLTWDATMYRFYGITPDKFGGTYEVWLEKIHSDDLPEVRRAVQQALLDGSDFSAEFRIVWPDGSIHWIKANALIERDSEGRPLRVTGTNLDITGDKLLVEAAEAASRAKSLFIGNMSHELRTPLSGVLGMTDLLLNTPVTDKQRGYAETIQKSGKALLVVVSDILDFSKIEAGKMDLERSPFLVEAVIANVVNLFGPPAAEEKIGLHSTIDPELPAVRGDAHRLTQVVSNLVGNAVKFTKAGEIRVSVKILRRTEAEVDLAISVQDTGIGMTEEELSRIFTPFTQGDTTTARRFGGTGLGLTISRNLVELMGGTLQVESVFGKGSLFTVLVTFPVAEGFARRDLKFVPINPVAPATPARPELPPGDMAELQTLLEQMKKPLDNGEPMPCKEILAVLLQKSWPEEQETLLAELDRLVKRYRLQEALDRLNAEK